MHPAGAEQEAYRGRYEAAAVFSEQRLIGALKALALSGWDGRSYVCISCWRSLKVDEVTRRELEQCQHLSYIVYTYSGAYIDLRELWPSHRVQPHRLMLCPPCSKRLPVRHCIGCSAAVPETLHRWWWCGGQMPSMATASALRLSPAEGRWFGSWSTLCPLCVQAVVRDLRTFLFTWELKGVFRGKAALVSPREGGSASWQTGFTSSGGSTTAAENSSTRQSATG